MIGSKDFAVGCLLIIFCIILIPILWLAFKISLFVAIPLAILGGAIIAIAVIGRIIRFIYAVFIKERKPA